MKFQYIDPHNEGTFVSNGERYYLSELYNKPIGIIKPIAFFPVGSLKAGGTSFVSTTGTTRPVYSSGHIDGKIVLFFDTPNFKPEQLQFYAYLDTESMLFPAGMKSKGTVDKKEFQLDQKIQEQVAYSKLDMLGKIWYNIKPFAIPALALLTLSIVGKFKK